MNENPFDRLVMVAPGTDYGWYMWSDIDTLDNETSLYSPIRIKNLLACLLHHIHFSYRLNSIVDLPLKRIWDYANSLEEIDFLPSKRYCILLADNAIMRMRKGYLAELKQKSNVTVVLVIVNKIAPRKKLLTGYFDVCDLIYTFDEDDAREYRIRHTRSIYSTREYKLDDDCIPASDVFYVGNDSGRLGKIYEIYNILLANGLRLDFYVNGVNRSRRFESGITYNHWLRYEDVVKHVKFSKAVLEIVSKNQVGFTMRTFEAVLFNKHLITNNASIRHNEFYDERFIHVVESAEDAKDINADVLQDVPDYGYDGELSPLHIVDDILKWANGEPSASDN